MEEERSRRKASVRVSMRRMLVLWVHQEVVCFGVRR